MSLPDSSRKYEYDDDFGYDEPKRRKRSVLAQSLARWTDNLRFYGQLQRLILQFF